MVTTCIAVEAKCTNDSDSGLMDVPRNFNLTECILVQVAQFMKAPEITIRLPYDQKREQKRRLRIIRDDTNRFSTSSQLWLKYIPVSAVSAVSGLHLLYICSFTAIDVIHHLLLPHQSISWCNCLRTIMIRVWPSASSLTCIIRAYLCPMARVFHCTLCISFTVVPITYLYEALVGARVQIHGYGNEIKLHQDKRSFSHQILTSRSL